MKKYLLGFGVLVALLIVASAWHTNHHSKLKPVGTKGSYVALGDSVAAGVGLQGDSDSSACDRTNQSYPKLVASKLGFSVHNLACSGATMANGVLGKQDVNELLVTPQLTQLFALSKPKLVTFTIGANDAHWSDIITSCYTGDCDTAANTLAVASALTAFTTSMQTTLDQLKQHYTTPPPVIVTNYYQVFPTSVPANCSDLQGITASELSWLRARRDDINTAIQQAVTGYSFVHYAAADFSGHELCSNDSWVQGLTADDPYHPTAAGQAAIAAKVVSTYKQVTK